MRLVPFWRAKHVLSRCEKTPFARRKQLKGCAITAEFLGENEKSNIFVATKSPSASHEAAFDQPHQPQRGLQSKVMKHLFLLFLLLPLLAQVYVSRRAWQLLPLPLWIRVSIVLVMSLAFIAFFVSLSPWLDRVPMGPACVLYQAGTSWIIILLYLVMAFGLLDLACLLHLVPRSLLRQNLATTLTLAGLLVALFGYASLHYEKKQRVEMTIDTRGKVERPLRLVLVSDLHLGYHNRRSDLRRWLGLLGSEHPDALLIAGDLIDRSIRPVTEERMAEEFRAFGVPVYAIPGNHDYYAGIDNDLAFCREAGITLLRDSTAAIGDVTIVGRDDRTNPHRKPLQVLMQGIDRHRFILELDHQPYHLEEAEQAGADFEFAGHTHHGQVWPISWITEAIYECAFGPLTKGQTRYYVSSGLGIWGAKFRIGTQSEYLVLNLR